MRLIGLRLPILAVLVLASSSVPTRAQVLYLETADWLPTASVLALPTSYVVAGTYAVPTSYTIPTVYATAYVTESALLAPTTYVAPTYYETRFRRGGLFGRRLVETTRAYYLPTTAYYPTTYYYPTRSIRPRSIRPPITIRPRTIRPRFWILPSYPPATRPPAPATAVAATRSSPPRPRFECTHPSKRRLPPLRLHEPIRVPGHRQSRASRPRTIRSTQTCPNFLRVSRHPGRMHRVRPRAGLTHLPIPRLRPVCSLSPQAPIRPPRRRPHQEAWSVPGRPPAPRIWSRLPPAIRRLGPAQAGNDAWFKSRFSRRLATFDRSTATCFSAESRPATPTSRRKACGSPSPTGRMPTRIAWRSPTRSDASQSRSLMATGPSTLQCPADGLIPSARSPSATA